MKGKKSPGVKANRIYKRAWGIFVKGRFYGTGNLCSFEKQSDWDNGRSKRQYSVYVTEEAAKKVVKGNDNYRVAEIAITLTRKKSK